jgi:SAM-dependent methyltransferase
MNTIVDFSKLTWRVLRRQKLKRNIASVTKEYSDGWDSARDKLNNSKTIADWLNDNDKKVRYYNINGKFSKQIFDSSDFYRRTFLDAFDIHFKDAKTVAEFGCGTGRNLIYLHLHHPELKLFGFELCESGVTLANDAAAKFNLPIKYFQLDYLNWIPSIGEMPDIDTAFTIFSLEQIAEQIQNQNALNNIFSRVNLGTFHLEPVVENYPWSIRGLIARIDHYMVDYLKGFDKSVKLTMHGKKSFKKVINSSHNPLMYPSLYVLKK